MDPGELTARDAIRILQERNQNSVNRYGTDSRYTRETDAIIRAIIALYNENVEIKKDIRMIAGQRNIARSHPDFEEMTNEIIDTTLEKYTKK